jgi:hypothetical protein
MDKINSKNSKIRRIVSAPISGAENPVSALTVENGEVRIVNPTDITDSSGRQVAAGAGTILSAGDGDSSINASYIKTGVLDANLLRTGQLQTIASWNNKNYGSVEDSIEAQQGYTGGYVYLTDWTTVSPNVVYATFATWGDYLSGTTTGTTAAATYFTVGDYVRVTGANFGTPGNNKQPDGENANVGVVDQDDGPVNYGLVVAVDTVGTGVFYTVSNTGKAELETGKVARSQAFIPTMSKAHKVISVTSSQLPAPNPAQVYEVIVTTSDDHHLVPGDYVELYNCGAVYSGVWYVVNCPQSNVFSFRHRFGIDAAAALGGADLPSLETPVAIRVRKTYAVSANGDLTAASLNIQTARTQDGGDPIFQVLNDSVIIRKPDGTILLSANTVGSSLDIGTVIADELTVGGDIDANQIVRIGTNVSPAFRGIWAGNATPTSAEFSVDLDGNLVASNANITGTVRASSGQIGGFTIGATALTATNIVADSSGFVSVGSGNNVAVISGADANYRIWAGNSSPALAKFVVDKAGNITASGTLFASNANITGAVNATSGSFSGTVTASTGRIGGFTIGATALTATNIVADSSGYVSVGSGSNVAVMSGNSTYATTANLGPGQPAANEAGYRFWAGNADPRLSAFVADKAGNVTAKQIFITGGYLNATDFINVNNADTVIGTAAINGAKIVDATITNAKIQSLSADKITAGTIDARDINVVNLDANQILAGDIGLFAFGGSRSSGLSQLIFFGPGEGNTARGVVWDIDRLTLNDLDTYQYGTLPGAVVRTDASTKRIEIENGAINVYEANVPKVAIDGSGINASAITLGAMPGGSNMIPNSSFELSGFSSPSTSIRTLTVDLANWLTSSNINITAVSDALTMTTYGY